VGASVDKAALLRRHGVQVTAERTRAVLDRPHSAAAKIAVVVRSEIGAISVLVARRRPHGLDEPDDAPVSEGRRGVVHRLNRIDNSHHHLICRTRSHVVDVDCAVGTTSCLTAAENSGSIDEPEVMLGPTSRLRRGGRCLIRRVIGCRAAEQARYASSGCAERQQQPTIIGTKH
jgi:hypothetical protein